MLPVLWLAIVIVISGYGGKTVEAVYVTPGEDWVKLAGEFVYEGKCSVELT